MDAMVLNIFEINIVYINDNMLNNKWALIKQIKY